MRGYHRIVSQGLNSGYTYSDTWRATKGQEHYSYFRVVSPDGGIDERITQKGKRYNTLSTMRYAMDLLKAHPCGCAVIWSDAPHIFNVIAPRLLACAYCAYSYKAEDGTRCAALSYYDENNVKRAIDPTRLLAHFIRG